MVLYNRITNKIVSRNIVKASSFLDRLLGLIPRSFLGKEEGLWLEPCNSIHMCFMRFAIDAVFLDKNMYVVKIIENFKPWHFSPFVKNARSVIELPAGHTNGCIKLGNLLELNEQ